MGFLGGALRSARITFRIHRFEVIAASLAVLGLAAAAIYVKFEMDGVGASRQCLIDWIASGGQPAAGCADLVRRWSDLSNDHAGKVMGAMLFVPFSAGLLLGVPLVGQELEARTAATAWALAGSRARWLRGRLAPILALAMGLGLVLSVASTLLQGTRSVDGTWDWNFDAALFFGPPVLAHLLEGLAIGLVIGTIARRTLPAFIVGAVISMITGFVLVSMQRSFQPPFPNQGDTSGEFVVGGVPALPNADWQISFAAPDGRLLSQEDALATVPQGTTDLPAWLQDHYVLIMGGPADHIVRAFQATEAVSVLVLAGVLLLAAFPIVERRRPS
jgi:hypothetical protein